MRALFPALLPLALLAGCIEVAWPPGPVMPTAEPQAGFSQALEAFRSGHHAGAYGRFAGLADAGHVDAAQIALVMVRHGESLFGSDWSATTAQQQRWTALVVNAARRRLDAEDNERGD